MSLLVNGFKSKNLALYFQDPNNIVHFCLSNGKLCKSNIHENEYVVGLTHNKSPLLNSFNPPKESYTTGCEAALYNSKSGIHISSEWIFI